MAVRFTGTGQHYSRALGLGSQTDLTICLWAKVSVDLNDITSLVSIDNGTSDYFALKGASDGTTMRALTDAGVHATSPMAVGTWYFIAMTVNSTGGTLMTKALGELDLTMSTWSDPHVTNAATLRIGVWGSGGNYFNGSIAGLRIWTAAMTDVELEAESYGFAPSRLDDLVAYYRFVRPSTTDDSGNGRTLSGGAGASYDPDPVIGNTYTLTETFEDDVPTFDMTGTWERTTDYANSGGWSFRSSSTIEDDGTSVVEVIAPSGATSVSFAYKVSSEPTYDHLDVFIDGFPAFDAQSGEVPWTQAGPFPVATGSTVQFSYSKDVSDLVGEDAAYIDDLAFTVTDPPWRFNTFDGGVAGPLNPANSGGANGDALDLVVGSPAFSDAVSRHGGLVVANTVAGSDTHIDWTGITQPGDTICARMYVYRTGTPVESGGLFALIGPTGVVSKTWVFDDGLIAIYTGAVDAPAATALATLPLDQWVRLEWRFTIDPAGQGTAEMWIYLTADSSLYDDYVISPTLTWPGGKPRDAEFHIPRDVSSQCYVDEIAVANVKIGSAYPAYVYPIGQVAEVGAARTVTGRKAGRIGQVTAAGETALPIRAVKVGIIGQVAETGAAGALAGGKRQAVAAVAESGAAAPVAPARRRTLGQPAETSSATAIVPDAGGTLARVTETGTALPIRPAKTRRVGQVAEASTPVRVAAGRRVPVGQVVGISTAATLRKIKVRLVGGVAETSSAQRISSGVLRQVVETGRAMPVTALTYRRRPMSAGLPYIGWQAGPVRMSWAAGQPRTSWSAGSPRP